eukprot:scaffold1097_cov246-Pinguiococcus_pyrenoidosus.AAC.4
MAQQQTHPSHTPAAAAAAAAAAAPSLAGATGSLTRVAMSVAPPMATPWDSEQLSISSRSRTFREVYLQRLSLFERAKRERRHKALMHQRALNAPSTFAAASSRGQALPPAQVAARARPAAMEGQAATPPRAAKPRLSMEMMETVVSPGSQPSSAPRSTLSRLWPQIIRTPVAKQSPKRRLSAFGSVKSESGEQTDFKPLSREEQQDGAFFGAGAPVLPDSAAPVTLQMLMEVSDAVVSSEDKSKVKTSSQKATKPTRQVGQQLWPTVAFPVVHTDIGFVSSV